MVKLQKIKRKDDTYRYFIYLPTEYIDSQGLVKGDELVLECNPFNFRVVITRQVEVMGNEIDLPGEGV